ncbi:NifU family protein [Actinoplanes teichomyceticus]|uniref:Fe-S cluster biogenesis protein NfuA n=1 Tax=Actinoplanes teichomyceticus TaxID=1867 RepID=A0A561WKP0_ACTTI|nr:NifU family protein [Actinoplanes teichomyceticus]TWG24400.1 Fe-S cluster biogenesis protein NfuA [Actinoplanes teichomyceticus]GIF12749.1 hypothetical protein Ate01nite_27810 [Actinoplanes teichomyceticus]
MVPVHPQSCPGRPDRLRWILPPGVLSGTGVAAAVPAPLAALLRDGTLAEVRVEPGAVLTTLAAGRAWGRDGARIRSALHAALDEPAGWTAPADPHGDQRLHAAAAELLDGSAGAFARSHGGRMELVDARDGVVTVRMLGACRGCPAAASTLWQRVEEQLRRRCPGLRAVVDAGPAR